MNILPRLIAIALRKYGKAAERKEPAVEMIARNAIRLAVADLGRDRAMVLIRDTLREGEA